jgi:hypothetical protein
MGIFNSSGCEKFILTIQYRTTLDILNSNIDVEGLLLKGKFIPTGKLQKLKLLGKCKFSFHLF